MYLNLERLLVLPFGCQELLLVLHPILGRLLPRVRWLTSLCSHPCVEAWTLWPLLKFLKLNRLLDDGLHRVGKIVKYLLWFAYVVSLSLCEIQG